MDIQNELFEVAARLAGASAMLRGRDDYEKDDELMFVDRLVCNALMVSKAAAEAMVDETLSRRKP